MFIGHFAVGLAASRWTPRTSLAWLLAAPLFLDILWPVLLLAGIEHARIVPGLTAMNPIALDHYPWSHSLVMSLAWGLLLGVLVRRLGGDSRAAGVIVALTVSHWVLDWITHSPDMPLWPGGPEFGLGLWNSVVATMALEVAMFVAGAAAYLRSTRARDRVGSLALWVMLALLLALYVASAVSPPPPDLVAAATAGLAMTLVFLAWAAWIARHREARE